MSNFQLVTTKQFNGVNFNCYRDTQEQDTQDFWATREQIGQALEYSEPRISIANIHNRYSDRIDKFSSVINLITGAGERETTIYNFRGLLEICRRSNQPKADAVMDFLYDIADEIRRTGSYSVNNEMSGGIMDGAQRVFAAAGITGNQLALAMDKIYRRHTGYSALEISGIELIAPEKEQILTPTQIGHEFGISARRVNEILAGAGYQHKIGDDWEPLPDGDAYATMLDTGKKYSDGTPIRQLKWRSGILDIVRELIA